MGTRFLSLLAGWASPWKSVWSFDPGFGLPGVPANFLALKFCRVLRVT